MYYEGIRDECFIQKSAKLISAGYLTLQCFADTMRLQKELLQKTVLFGKYKKISLHVFTVWMYSTLPAKDALKIGANRMDPDLVFSSAILNRDSRETKEITARYRLKSTY